MKLKLNGWQRLWVITSVAWVAAIIGFGLLELAEHREREAERQALQSEPKLPPLPEGHSLRDSILDQFDEDEVLTVGNVIIVMPTTVGLAFIPPILLYVAGWGIGWAYRGFRDASKE